MSIEIANQLLPESLKEQEVSELLWLCNLSKEQHALLREVFIRIMDDGIATGRNLNADNTTDLLEGMGADVDLQASEIDGYHRGFIDAIEIISRRKE